MKKAISMINLLFSFHEIRERMISNKPFTHSPGHTKIIKIYKNINTETFVLKIICFLNIAKLNIIGINSSAMITK